MDNKKIVSIIGYKREIFGTIDGHRTIVGKMTDLKRIQRVVINVYNDVGGNSH